MVMQQPRRRTRSDADGAANPAADVVRAARCCGLTVGRQVKIGVVRGVVIGYNIARRGRYPGRRFPLLVKTELGVGKFGIAEVVPA